MYYCKYQEKIMFSFESCFTHLYVWEDSSIFLSVSAVIWLFSAARTTNPNWTNKYLCVYEIFFFIIVFYFPIVHPLTLLLPFANINDT